MIKLSDNFSSHSYFKHFIEVNLFSSIFTERESYQHSLQKECPHFSKVFSLFLLNKQVHISQVICSISL